MIIGDDVIIDSQAMSHSLASLIPPGVIAKVASFSGMSGLEINNIIIIKHRIQQNSNVVKWVSSGAHNERLQSRKELGIIFVCNKVIRYQPISDNKSPEKCSCSLLHYRSRCDRIFLFYLSDFLADI